ncbi:hypothetical protein [Paenibacillus gorillae]|uniref:hypothetical protein n=1 Tax=Paenibacillus gorillae TaxID=1243662 RepID=UPI0012DFCCB0|nr:hypothetical protein [Paenibacillus gorillae]
MKKQFKNGHRMLESFGYEFIVQCPNCNEKSKVISPEGLYYRNAIIRFICMSCGLLKEMIPSTNCFNQNVISYGNSWREGLINIGGNYDWYFGYPLYLQVACCGRTLWAYNLEHLSYLEKYVEAELRGSSPYYLSVESRLPI